VPRINQVKKSRKDQGRCGRCGDPLPEGSPYRYWKFRYGGKSKRCLKASCNPRQSELTQSKLSGAYAAQENFEDSIAGCGTVEDVQALLEETADSVEEVADEYQESADAINETAEGSPVAEECEEKAEQLREWVEEIRGVDLPEDECPGECEDGKVDCACRDGDSEGDDECEEKGCEKGLVPCPECQGDHDPVEEARSAASDVAGECPV